MEKKRISNFAIFITTIVIIAVILITQTVVTINNRHEEKLLYAMHTKVEYYAKRCFLEDVCKDNVTLQMLYDNQFLNEEVVNPITKEVIDPNLEIKFEDNKIVITW